MFFESELSNARIIKYRGMQVTFLVFGGVGSPLRRNAQNKSFLESMTYK